MGCVQLGVMVSAVSGWIGSTVLALIISFVSAWIPIPWFLIGHWYFEGTLPWIYIAAWIVGWGTLTLATLMARDEPEAVIAGASRASVWILWYFKQGAITFLTAPLLFFLVYCIIASTFGAVIQGLALLRASYAVFGVVGALIILSFGLLPVIMPPFLYYSLIRGLPSPWLLSDVSRRYKLFSSLAVLVFFPLGAEISSYAVSWGISWIADRDPCAAFAAGVTGSKSPVNCP